MKIDENFILYELSDDDLINLTKEEKKEIGDYYMEHNVPEKSTVKGLLKKHDVKYDDLPNFVLNMNAGICNNVNRTEKQIYINRKDSFFKDSITINLNKNRDVPYVTLQVQVGDYFIHEEGYDEKGELVYRA